MTHSLVEVQEGKPLCSLSTLSRLEEEARQLMGRFRDNPPSVGDALFVEYDSVFCEKHKIGRFGRMTKKNGEVLYHAGPRDVYHPSVYVMDDHNLMDYVKQWQVGGYCSPPVDKILRGPMLPKKKEKIMGKDRIGRYEKELFKFLGEEKKQPITLVNPSFATMTALKSTMGGYVTLSSVVDEDWSRDVVDYVKQSKGRLVMLKPKQVRGVAYLGTNDPIWVPEQNHVRLILSPFISRVAEFPNYEVTQREFGIETRYEKKKGYVVHSTLYKDTQENIYNPETVDSYFCKEGSRWFFLESSFDLELDQEDDVKVGHSPWFVTYPSGLEWRKESITVYKGHGKIVEMDMYMKYRGGVLYDVKGPGTYLSRRSLCPPMGLKWVPLLSEGTHWVTYSTLHPRKMFGVKKLKDGENDLVVFEDAEVVKSLKKLDLSGPMVISCCPVQGLDSWPLLSDDGLWLVEQKEKLRVSPENLIKDCVVTERGQVFPAYQVVEDGAVFVPGGKDFHLLGLGRGQLFPLRVMHTKVGHYVVVPDRPGNKFLFPKASGIEMMHSTLSLFSKGWLSIAKQISGVEMNGSLVSTETFSQSLLERVTSRVIQKESDVGLTVNQIVQETGMASAIVYRQLQTTGGYHVWRVDHGQIYFTHEQSNLMRMPGEENDVTMDGKLWSRILFGMGKLKEKLLFANRKLQPLIDFLHWNYCMTVKRERANGLIELSVRRPRRS